MRPLLPIEVQVLRSQSMPISSLGHNALTLAVVTSFQLLRLIVLSAFAIVSESVQPARCAFSVLPPDCGEDSTTTRNSFSSALIDSPPSLGRQVRAPSTSLRAGPALHNLTC